MKRAADFERSVFGFGLQDRRRANEAKERHWNERKLDALTREIEEKEAEVRDCVTQIENGLALLVPDPAAESRNCPPPTQGRLIRTNIEHSKQTTEQDSRHLHLPLFENAVTKILNTTV